MPRVPYKQFAINIGENYPNFRREKGEDDFSFVQRFVADVPEYRNWVDYTDESTLENPNPVKPSVNRKGISEPTQAKALGQNLNLFQGATDIPPYLLEKQKPLRSFQDEVGEKYRYQTVDAVIDFANKSRKTGSPKINEETIGFDDIYKFVRSNAVKGNLGSDAPSIKIGNIEAANELLLRAKEKAVKKAYGENADLDYILKEADPLESSYVDALSRSKSLKLMAEQYRAAGYQDVYNDFSNQANTLESYANALGSDPDFQKKIDIKNKYIPQFQRAQKESQRLADDIKTTALLKKLDSDINVMVMPGLKYGREAIRDYIGGTSYWISDLFGSDRAKSFIQNNPYLSSDPMFADEEFGAPAEPGKPFNWDKVPGFMYKQTINMLPALAAGYFTGGAGMATKAGAISETIAGLGLGLESVATAKNVLNTIKFGSRAAGVAVTYYDDAIRELDQAAANSGVQVNPSQKSVLAALATAKTAAIESLNPLDEVLRTNVLKGFAKSAMSALATGKGFRSAMYNGANALMYAGKVYGLETGEELFDETIQRGLNAVSNEVLGLNNTDSQLPESIPTLGEYGDIAINTLVATVPFMGAGAYGASSNFKNDVFHSISRQGLAEDFVAKIEENRDNIGFKKANLLSNELQKVNNVYKGIPQEYDEDASRAIADKSLQIEALNEKIKGAPSEVIRARLTDEKKTLENDILAIEQMQQDALSKGVEPPVYNPQTEGQVLTSNIEDDYVLNLVAQRIEPIMNPLAERMRNAEEIDVAEIEDVASRMIEEVGNGDFNSPSLGLNDDEKKIINDLVSSQIDNLLNYEFATTTTTEQTGKARQVKGVVRTAKPGLPQKVSTDRFLGARVTNPKTGERGFLVLTKVPVTQSRTGLKYQFVSEAEMKRQKNGEYKMQQGTLEIGEEIAPSTPFTNMEYVSSNFGEDGNLTSVVVRDAKTGNQVQIDDQDLALDIAIAESQRQIGTVPEGAMLSTIQRVVPTERLVKIFPNLRETGTTPEAVGVEPQTEQNVRQETNVPKEGGNEGKAPTSLPQEGRQEGQQQELLTSAVAQEGETPPATREDALNEAAATSETPEEYSKKLIDILNKAKADTKNANDAMFAIPALLYNGAIDVAILAIKGGASIADAINAAVQYVSEKFDGTWQESEFRQYLSNLLPTTKGQPREVEEIAKALDGVDTQPLKRQLGIETNWDMIGEGDFLSGVDPILAYTQRQLPDWNRESQRGNINPNSEITYDIVRGNYGGIDQKGIVQAKDENGVVIGVVELDAKGGIDHIAVAPEFRGKGVSDKLIQTLKENNPQLDLSKTKLRSKGFEKAFGNKIIAEAYHKAKSKPEREQTPQDKELVKAVEELIGKTAEKTATPASTNPALSGWAKEQADIDADTKLTPEQKEKAKIESTAKALEGKNVSKIESERISNIKLSSPQGEINTGDLKIAKLPSKNVDKVVGQADGKNIKVEINFDKLQGVLLERSGKQLFRAMQGRLFTLAKVGDFYLPFYISSAGTSGKNQGEWYPFFGYNNWLVKGRVGKAGEMEYSSEIDKVTKLLNDNLKIPVKYINQFGEIASGDRYLDKKDANGNWVKNTERKIFYNLNDDIGYESWFVEFDTKKDNKYTEDQFVADRTGLNPKKVVNDGKGSADAWISDVIALTENSNTASKGVIPSSNLSEAYHKAKKDESNPELVKAVDELLRQTTEAKQEKTSVKDAAKGVSDAFNDWLTQGGRDPKSLGFAALDPQQDAERFAKLVDATANLVKALVDQGVTRASTALNLVKPYFRQNLDDYASRNWERFSNRYFKDQFDLALIEKYPELYKQTKKLQKNLDKALTANEKLILRDLQEAKDRIITKINDRLNPSNWQSTTKAKLPKTLLTNESIAQLKSYRSAFSKEELSEMDAGMLKELYKEINLIYKSGRTDQKSHNKILSDSRNAKTDSALVAIARTLGLTESINSMALAKQKLKRPGVKFYAFDNDNPSSVIEIPRSEVESMESFFDKKSGISVIGIDTDVNTSRQKQGALGRIKDFFRGVAINNLFDTRNIMVMLGNDEESINMFLGFTEKVAKANFERDEMKNQVGRFDEIANELKKNGYDISKREKSIRLRIGDKDVEGTSENGLTIGQIIDVYMMLRDPDALVRSDGNGLVNYNEEDVDRLIDYVNNNQPILDAVKEVNQRYSDFLNEKILPVLNAYGYSVQSFNPRSYSTNGTFSKNDNENARAIEILNRVYRNNIPQSIPYSPLSIFSTEEVIPENFDVASETNKEKVISVLSNNVISRKGGGQINIQDVSYKYNNYMNGVIDMVTSMPVLFEAQSLFGKDVSQLIENKLGKNAANAIRNNINRVVTNRVNATDAESIVGGSMNWLNRAVLGQMFFNVRSMIFQPVALTNYAAIAPDIEDYFNKSAALIKSPSLFANTANEISSFAWVRERLGGRIFSIDAAELEERTRRKTNIPTFNFILDKALKLGYTPIAAGDFASIIVGGSGLYNSVKESAYNKYIKTMSAKQAEELAIKDASFALYKATNESQQSSNNMLISNGQKNPVIRMFLSFTTANQQLMRGAILSAQLMKKGVGSPARNIYKILQYGFANAALFTLVSRAPEILYGLFDGDDDESDLLKQKQEKELRAKYYNETIGSILSGLGAPGVILNSAMRGVLPELISDEGFDEVTMSEKLSRIGKNVAGLGTTAPGVSIKVRQFADAIEAASEGKPIKSAAAATSFVLGLPTSRAYDLVNQFSDAVVNDYTVAERILRATDIFNKSWEEKRYNRMVLEGKQKPENSVELKEIRGKGIKEINKLFRDLGFEAGTKGQRATDAAIDKIKTYSEYAAKKYNLTYDQYNDLVENFNKGYFAGQVPKEMQSFARMSSNKKVEEIAKKILSFDNELERQAYVQRLDEANIDGGLATKGEIARVQELVYGN